jgi:hypothetical protein
MSEPVNVRDDRKHTFFIVDNALIEKHGRAIADPAVRRQLRALVRGPLRMTREAAERLLERYWTARRGDVDDYRSPAHEARASEKLQRATAAIIARLTGHADGDDADA